MSTINGYGWNQVPQGLATELHEGDEIAPFSSCQEDEPMATANGVFDLLARHVVVPVIAIDSADSALPLDNTLLEEAPPVE